MDFGAFCVV